MWVEVVVCRYEGYEEEVVADGTPLGQVRRKTCLFVINMYCNRSHVTSCFTWH